MELSRTRITGSPFSFSRWCLLGEGVEQSGAGAGAGAFCSPLVISATGPGTGDTSGAAGRYRTKRRRRGDAKFVSLNSRQQNTTVVAPAVGQARRGMGVSLDPLLK